jgi:hypothetical protein
MSKKVLIITCYFPPHRSIGALRPKGLAKYLPRFGWEPIILTPELPDEPEKKFRVLQTRYPENVILWLKEKIGLDPARSIHKQVRVPLVIGEGKKTFTKRFDKFVKSIIHYPNKKRGWCPHAIKTGSELLESEKIDAIISSSPPETTHLVAKELKRRFNLPWIADFRDLWTQFHNYRYGPIRKWFEKRLEIKILSDADALVAVSQLWADKLKTLNRGKNAFAITNGFDPEEVVSSPLTKKFTIRFTFYGNSRANR